MTNPARLDSDTYCMHSVSFLFHDWKDLYPLHSRKSGATLQHEWRRRMQKMERSDTGSDEFDTGARCDTGDEFDTRK